MRLAVLAICLFAAGCTGIRPGGPAPADPPAADALRARLGAAACVTASLLVRIVGADGEGEIFTLRLWAPGDGRVRVLANKLDVDFLTALVAADGTYTAVLPRARLWTRGRLGGADDPVLLRDLALLVAEVAQGPVPARAAVGAGPDGQWRFADPATGWQAAVRIGGDGLPSGKTLSGRDGAELRRLAYSRWQDFDGLHRPSVTELRAAGDPSVCTIRVKTLDAPPTISPERMALAVPDGAAEVAPAEFTRRIGD